MGADGTVEEKYVTTNVYDDRNRVVKQTTKNKAGTVVYEVSTEYSDASGTVSYTHLDVYKRQILHSGLSLYPVQPHVRHSF